MDLPQMISTVAVLVLTVVATIIGVQLILLLKELKTSLTRFNRVLDSAEIVIEKITQPITGIVGLAEGIRQSTKVIEIISNFLQKQRQKDKPVNFRDDDPI